MRTQSRGKHLEIPERYVDIKAASKYLTACKNTLGVVWSREDTFYQDSPSCLFYLYDIDKIMNSFKHSSNQHEKTANKIIGDIHGN